MGNIIVIAIPLLLWTIYVLYDSHRRKKKLLKELNHLRDREIKRFDRVFKEEPKRIILASKIIDTIETVRFVGHADKLDKSKYEENDLIYKNDCLYLFKDSDLYKIINDLPNPCPQGEL